MIGRRPLLGGLAAVVLSAPSLSYAQRSPQGSALDVLFTAFAKSPGLYAKFHEEKQIALLVAPLKSDGTVHFDPKKGLARHTTSPSKRSVLLGGGTLTVWDGTKTETIQLSSQPSLRAFAEAFTMFLSADRAGLERMFKLDFTGDPRASWRLRLAPISAQLKKIVTEMEVVGQGALLTTLRVTEASGDVGTTSFSDVDASKQYTPAEAVTIFRVPATGPTPR